MIKLCIPNPIHAGDPLDFPIEIITVQKFQDPRIHRSNFHFDIPIASRFAHISHPHVKNLIVLVRNIEGIAGEGLAHEQQD